MQFDNPWKQIPIKSKESVGNNNTGSTTWKWLFMFMVILEYYPVFYFYQLKYIILIDYIKLP